MINNQLVSYLQRVYFYILRTQSNMWALECFTTVLFTGIPGLITADMVREGATVIDVGINYVQDPVTGKTKLVGDVDFEGKTPNLLINGGGARFWLSCFEKETVPGLRAVLLLTPLCVSEGNHTSSTLPSSTCPSSPSCPCSQTSKCNIHFSACLFSEKQPKAYTGRHSTNKLWFLTMREGGRGREGQRE